MKHFINIRLLYFVFMLSVMGVIFYFSHQDGEVSKEVSKQVVSNVEDAKHEIKKEEKAEAVEVKPEFHLTDIVYLVLGGLLAVTKVGIRNFAHVFLYWLLGIAVFLVLKDVRRISHKLCWALGICFLYSISDEFHQMFIPGRDGQIEDLLMDAAGYVVALVVCHVIAKWMHRRKVRRTYTI